MMHDRKEGLAVLYTVQAIAAESDPVHVHKACLWKQTMGEEFRCCFSYDSVSGVRKL